MNTVDMGDLDTLQDSTLHHLGHTHHKAATHLKVATRLKVATHPKAGTHLKKATHLKVILRLDILSMAVKHQGMTNLRRDCFQILLTVLLVGMGEDMGGLDTLQDNTLHHLAHTHNTVATLLKAILGVMVLINLGGNIPVWEAWEACWPEVRQPQQQLMEFIIWHRVPMDVHTVSLEVLVVVMVESLSMGSMGSSSMERVMESSSMGRVMGCLVVARNSRSGSDLGQSSRLPHTHNKITIT